MSMETSKYDSNYGFEAESASIEAHQAVNKRTEKFATELRCLIVENALAEAWQDIDTFDLPTPKNKHHTELTNQHGDRAYLHMYEGSEQMWIIVPADQDDIWYQVIGALPNEFLL